MAALQLDHSERQVLSLKSLHLLRVGRNLLIFSMILLFSKVILSVGLSLLNRLFGYHPLKILISALEIILGINESRSSRNGWSFAAVLWIGVNIVSIVLFIYGCYNLYSSYELFLKSKQLSRDTKSNETGNKISVPEVIKLKEGQLLFSQKYYDEQNVSAEPVSVDNPARSKATASATELSGFFTPKANFSNNSSSFKGIQNLTPFSGITLNAMQNPAINMSSSKQSVGLNFLNFNHDQVNKENLSYGSINSSINLKSEVEKRSHNSDEQAYSLLQTLKVDWIPSVHCVEEGIDDWTENFRSFLRKYIKEEILEKFERNCNDILDLLLDNNFAQLMNPALANVASSIRKEEQRLVKLLSYDVANSDDPEYANGNDDEFRFQQEDESDREMERLMQQCQILVLSANDYNIKRQLEERYSSLKKYLYERKALERFFGLVRYVTNPNSVEIKRYVLKRLHVLVNSGKTMPKYNWSGGASNDFKVERFPTDAEILFNVCAVWMDNVLRQKRGGADTFSEHDHQIHMQRNFYQLHVRDTSACDLNSLVQQKFWGILIATPRENLCQTHFKVMVQGKIWEVRSGRLNIFHTFLLLIYSMKVMNIQGIDRIEELVGGKPSKKHF